MGENLNRNGNCIHMYSKSINEPRPRLCVHCGKPEVCRACHGEGDIHMCGKDFTPTLGEHIIEFMEGNCLTDMVIRTRNKMGGDYDVRLSEVLGDFHGFMGTRKVKEG